MRSTHSCHLLLTRKKMRTCSRKRQIMKEFTKDAKNLRFCWKKKKELILVKMTKNTHFLSNGFVRLFRTTQIHGRICLSLCVSSSIKTNFWQLSSSALMGKVQKILQRSESCHNFNNLKKSYFISQKMSWHSSIGYFILNCILYVI